MKGFKPLLAPNKQVPIEDLPYPLLASVKLDGIRCIFKDGRMVSRALKEIPNVQLQEKFQSLKDYSKENDVILDGELFTDEITFSELSGLCRRLDAPVPESLKFHCFDCIIKGENAKPFIKRYKDTVKITEQFRETVEVVKHHLVGNVDWVKRLFDTALDRGFEGLMLRSVEGIYKYGRGTINQGIIFKLKPYVTFDAQIIDVTQATKVDPKAEKKTNELGYSETSKKKGDRIPIDKAADFVVMHEEERELKVVIAMTDEQKKEVWKNREDYIGRTIEYKGLLVGSKDLPRHPVFLRFRDDKDV